MAFGNLIHIGKLGITGAIKQRLLEENISVKNFDISIWQEIMDTIKDDENLKNIYTGSTNLKDKNAFFVAKETTVNISDALWNKILNVINRFNGKLPEQHNTQKVETIIPQNITNNSSPSSRGINLQSEYPNIPYNANGDVDFNELTLDKLKSKFPSSEYTIDINNKSEYITVKRKSDGKFILSCANTTSYSGEKLQMVAFEHNGVLTQLNHQNGKFTQRTTFNNDKNKCILNTTEDFNNNGDLIRKETWNNDNTGYVAQIYSNGILCKETTYTKDKENNVFFVTNDKNYLSDKLINEINRRINARESGIGFLQKTDEIEKYILNGIATNTVSDVLYNYTQVTGRDLIQDIIDDKMGLSYEKQKELLTHITTAYKDSIPVTLTNDYYYEGTGIGYELQFALKNNDIEMLKNALNNVNKDNVQFVLSNIYNPSDNATFTDISENLYTKLTYIIGDDADEYISKFSDAMIQNINENGGYSQDIADDIKANKDSKTKLGVDFTRLLNRCEAGQTSTITGKSDGAIDISNIKQQRTGDCWLIASVLSSSNKNQKGLDYINNMLSVDNNGNVTVNLKGVDKTYVISAEEIEKANHLASGDPDMRAIEIAVDKYMKEYSYELTEDGNPDYSRADINGDYESFAYNILFGNGYLNRTPDITKDDYNNENLVYTLSFGSNPNVKATVLGAEKQSEVNLIGRHAYAITKSDNKYIYLVNPHNSADTLKVERELLKSKNPRVYFALIGNNEE